MIVLLKNLHFILFDDIISDTNQNERNEWQMSQRMTLQEVISEYGTPQIKLDIHARRTECLKLRERLMAIRDLSQAKEQGYLDIDCKLFIDVDDIDRYLSGELDTLGEIYAFPEDVKSFKENLILLRMRN